MTLNRWNLRKTSSSFNNLFWNVQCIKNSENKTSSECGFGWVNDPLGDSCYLVKKELLVWSAAEDECIKQGAHLISLDSVHEQGYISGMIHALTYHLYVNVIIYMWKEIFFIFSKQVHIVKIYIILIMYTSGFLHSSKDDYLAFWIGANSRTDGEGFKWSNGAPFVFYNWFPGSPI